MAKIKDEEYMEHRRAIVRESQKKRRARAVANGMCSICCVRKPDAGHVTCRACRQRIIDGRRKA